MLFILRGLVEFIFVLLYGAYTYVHTFLRTILPIPKKSLVGEVFLITGSASGIGREVALHLAKNHVKTTLVLWDWNDDTETVETAKFFGAKVFSYRVDVTNREEVARTAKLVAQDAGDVTILFNNAGVAGLGDLLSQTPEKVEKTIQVNLISHFWTLKAFLPSMIRRNHGHIVTTASGSAFWGLRNEAPYSASKYAIRGYVESLQAELRHHPLKPTNIKFTTIFPAFVRTPLLSRVHIKSRIPYITKAMEPRYVAETIVDGICQNQETLFIPKSTELVARIKCLIPRKFLEYCEDLIITDVTFEEENDESHDDQDQ